jgi:hypothetical protein
LAASTSWWRESASTVQRGETKEQQEAGPLLLRRESPDGRTKAAFAVFG